MKIDFNAVEAATTRVILNAKEVLKIFGWARDVTLNENKLKYDLWGALNYSLELFSTEAGFSFPLYSDLDYIKSLIGKRIASRLVSGLYALYDIKLSSVGLDEWNNDDSRTIEEVLLLLTCASISPYQLNRVETLNNLQLNRCT